MRPTTRWERFKRHFVWGSWSWRTALYRNYGDERIYVLGKLKVTIHTDGSA